MPKLFDTHCHFIDFDIDTITSLTPLLSNIELLSVSKSPSDWSPNIDLCSHYQNIYPALGVHPWYVHDINSLENDLIRLDELVNSEHIRILGEIGLDFAAEYLSTRSIQERYFAAQVELSVRKGLSLSIHCRKAFDAVLSELKGNSIERAVMHGFSGSHEQAKPFVDMGYKLGVGSQILNLQSTKYEKLIKYAPLDSLVLETDAPYAKVGADMNLVQRLQAISERIAAIKKVSLEEVVSTTYNSARLILGLNYHDVE
ncbi:MAG: TatD family hydrolase [Thiotrichales bacterium]|nr:TatD family hydrolase [Thiotrichales bacterium]